VSVCVCFSFVMVRIRRNYVVLVGLVGGVLVVVVGSEMLILFQVHNLVGFY
jgi:hypothetical protein